MAYIGLSIICSALAVVLCGWGLRRSQDPFSLLSIGFFLAAAGGGIFAAITGQFAVFDSLTVLFGFATGIALTVTIYFLIRSQEENSLAFAPAGSRLAMTGSLILALFYFDGVASVNLYGGIGLGIGLLALSIFLFSRKPEETLVPQGNRYLSSLFLLSMFAFTYLGFYAFDAVMMAHGEEGIFLLSVFATVAALLLALSLMKKQRPVGLDYAWAVAFGLPLFAGFLFFLLAFTSLPNWQVLGIGAFGHTVLTALLGIVLLGDRYQLIGYFSLAGLVAGSILLSFG